MSRFFTGRLKELVPYVPGEQPRDMKYVKLNTNESPFPPSPGVLRAVAEESGRLQLYSDPDCKRLTAALAKRYGVGEDQILLSNGSDEVLNFAFQAFADEEHPLVFPDLTYGFYPVFAALNRIPYREIPLREDLTVDPEDYIGVGATVVIANPNAPTGLPLPLSEVERIVASNPDNVVIVDEAYVDFGAESAVGLVERYPNLLVTMTFSKSRSMAGARLGFGIGQRELIADLHTVRYSTNPYNVNRMTEAAGAAAIEEDDYYMENCRTIVKNREWAAEELRRLGFEVTDSKANFLFAASDRIDGEELYRKLKEKGVLVRHFGKERIKRYNRITVGTEEQMQILLDRVKEILEEKT